MALSNPVSQKYCLKRQHSATPIVARVPGGTEKAKGTENRTRSRSGTWRLRLRIRQDFHQAEKVKRVDVLSGPCNYQLSGLFVADRCN